MASSYWIGDAEGRVLGPVTLDIVQELVSTGRLQDVTRASTDGRGAPRARTAGGRPRVGPAARDAGEDAARAFPHCPGRFARRLPQRLLQTGEALLPGPSARSSPPRLAPRVLRRLSLPQPTDGAHRERAHRGPCGGGDASR